MHSITYSFLLAFIFICSSCQGQDRKAPSPGAGQPKLMKNRFADEVVMSYWNVHCGLMDRFGNLWFGTTGQGVYRYDGKLFTNYTTKEGLINNNVYSVLEDRAGNIWFGTHGGVSKYDGKTFTNRAIMAPNGVTVGPLISGSSGTSKNTV